MASPCALIVPNQYPEALNFYFLEYSVAQGVQVALHSLRLAYEHVSRL